MKSVFAILLLASLPALGQIKETKKGKYSGREVTATKLEVKKGQTVNFTGDVYLINVSSNNKANTVQVTFANKKIHKGKGMYVQVIPLEEFNPNPKDTAGTKLKRVKEDRNYFNKNSPTRSVKVSQKSVLYYYTVTTKKK